MHPQLCKPAIVHAPATVHAHAAVARPRAPARVLEQPHAPDVIVGQLPLGAPH